MADILDPFEGPRLKVERAKHHIKDHTATGSAFVDNGGFYAPTFQLDRDTGKPCVTYGLAKPFPGELRLTAADALYNLRSALDQAVCRCVVLTGESPEGTYFPHGIDKAGFEASLKAKCKKVPPAIRGDLETLEPYYGGDGELFRVLHDLNIIDKHTDLIAASLNLIGSQGVALREPIPPIRKSGEKTLVFVEKGHEEVKLTVAISFAEIEAVKHQSATQVLSQLCGMTSRTIDTFETTLRGLAII